MNSREILDFVKFLSKHQGFYEKLYKQLINNKKELEYLENQNFKDPIDLIIFFES